MPGTFIRGAFISFIPKFFIPVPNVIIFQYNPETMTHAWTQSEAAGEERIQANPLAVKGDPGESFSFTLAMDARDMIADGSVVAQGIATVSGIYTRLAALEMLQFPVDDPSVLGGDSTVPALQAPTVLFVWGPGRIVPVRVTQLSITETLYDPFLNPIHADATITVRVITADELRHLTGPLKEIASTAYDYSKGLRKGLAVANLANAAEGVIGMLPI
ncbi:MAG TPA: hypothetical protein VF266_00440 [Thermoanaerobaculia bacterium]